MNASGDSIERLIEAIHADERKGYLQERFPCELDGHISKLVRLFADGTDSDRRRIWALADWKLSGTLQCYAERMASLGVRERSRDRIWEGLVALVIEDHFGDWRDSLRVLAPLYDAAKKIGVEPDSLFLEVANRYRNAVAISIKQFTERFPENQSLAAFDYSESADADGFRYERNFKLDKELLRKHGIDLD